MSEFHGEIPPDSVIGNSPLNPHHPSSSAYRGPFSYASEPPAELEHEFVPLPSAWQSLPGAVRFAVWLWALSSIVGVVVGVVAALGLVLGWAWS